MGKKNPAEPRPRSITEQYDLYWRYEHYLAAKSYMESKGHDLPQMLKDAYHDGTFSNWKNGIYPFDLDKIAAVMLTHDILWGHVLFKDARILKRNCLAKTIDRTGQRGGIQGKFAEGGGLDIMIYFVRSSLKARRAGVGRLDQAHAHQFVYDDLRQTCQPAARRTVDELSSFVKTWSRYYADAVLELRESFAEYATDLDRLTER